MASNVYFKTEDRIQLAATHYPGKDDGVILLHMLPSDRHEWKHFANKLNELGYDVIAIDYRWQTNPNAIHKDAVLDVKAARQYLRKDRIFIIGSSIGANLALNYAVNDKDVKGIVLLSAGENYRGVETFNAMKKYNDAVMIVSSEDDMQSFNASRQLYQIAKGDKELKLYKDAGHGTMMLAKHPELMGFIITWINKHR